MDSNNMHTNESQDWRDKVIAYAKDLKQRKGISWEKVAEELGIPKTTLGEIRYKRVGAITDETRQKLYESTELECLANPLEPLEREEDKGPAKGLVTQVLKNLDADVGDMRNILLRGGIPKGVEKEVLDSYVPDPDDMARTTSDIGYAFVRALTYFAENPEYIVKLEKEMSPEFTGQLTALLNALYSKDKSKKWMLDLLNNSQRR
jgi:transcriptional regulator with XRE-family HTH domain